MSNVSQLQPSAERKERRRLHLREVAQETDQTAEQIEQVEEPRETLGEALRNARAERGEEVAAIAAKLKMRRDQLEAIEANDFAKLPGRAYVVGFVRTYARYLGLDAEAMVQRFKDESAGDEKVKPVELVFPEAVDEPRMLPSGSILIWAMLIAMVIYVITYITMPDRRSPTTAKADRPAVVIEDPKDVKPTTESSVQDAWRPVAAPAADEAAVAYVAGGEVLPATQEEGSARLLTDDPALPPEMLFAVAQVTDVAPESPATQAAATAAPRIVLKALEQTYIQIKDPQRGPRGVLVSRVLEVGESYQAPDRAGLIMQTGNAGGLQVEVDGRVVGVLGKSGEVITRIPLDPSYFLERIATSQ